MAVDPTDPAAPLLEHAEHLYADLRLDTVRAWKAAHPGRPAIGHLPVYTPRELLYACETLPVGIVGGGDQIDIVKGDACFQSYICHIPRSTIELGLGNELDPLDGMVFPSTCDVIRNLSGIWQVLFPTKLSFFLDLPQSLDERGIAFYRTQLELLAGELEKRGGARPTRERLGRAIALYNANRRAIAHLHALRAEKPWLLSTDECFLAMRAGNLLAPEEHTRLLGALVEALPGRRRRSEDRIRVVVVGAFCESPPLGLLRTLERSGCYVVDDDFHLNHRWLEIDVPTSGDPLEALARAYVEHSTWASTRYELGVPKGELLVAKVKRLGADGVILAAPSFCDPALLDQPSLGAALDRAGIPYTLFKYAENTGQFQSVREQVGTFSDSIRLWGPS